MIELKKVTKKYGNTTAVNNLSLKISTGEVVGLLGPNGAGKSTTMKLITGFLVPDEGEIKIDKKNVTENLIYAKSKIGYMPENNPLYKDMLVSEAIKLSFDLHGVDNSKYNGRLNYVVKSTGLEEVFNKSISSLSKGYKQRVGLAQALVHDPQILILDEPTEGLDPNQRFEIRNLLKELGKKRTVIISTHVMQEVEAMCTRILMISKGQLQYDEPAETTFKDIKKQKISLEDLFRKVTLDNNGKTKTRAKKRVKKTK